MLLSSAEADVIKGIYWKMFWKVQEDEKQLKKPTPNCIETATPSISPAEDVSICSSFQTENNTRNVEIPLSVESLKDHFWGKNNQNQAHNRP